MASLAINYPSTYGGYLQQRADIGPGQDWSGYKTQEMQGQAAEQMRREGEYQNTMQNLSVEQARFQLQKEQEQWQLAKKNADSSAKLAEQFLGSWGSALSDIKSVYGDAAGNLKNLMSAFTGTGGTGDSVMSGTLKELGDLGDFLKTEYQSYQETYAPMAKEFMQGARELSGAKKEAIQGMTELAKTDIQGATSRAGADVARQSAIQNEMQARELMRKGVDPSSGAFGALTRRGAIETAGMTAMAMNQARVAEKNRAAGVMQNIATTAKPSEEAAIGMGMQKTGTEMLTSAANVAKAKGDVASSYANTVGNIATAQANLAGGYARDVVSPYAQMGGYFLGQAQAGGAAINPNLFNTAG